MTDKWLSFLPGCYSASGKSRLVIAGLAAVILLLLPGWVSAAEICFENLRVCVQKPDSEIYHIYQAPADMTYEQAIVNGGLLFRAESKEGGKFMNLSVVKADMTDIYREDFYQGYVFGSVKSKEELGRLVVRKKTTESDDSLVTTFEEIGRLNQLVYTAKHKIQLRGNFIYTFSVGRISAEAKEFDREGDLLRFLDSVRYLQP